MRKFRGHRASTYIAAAFLLAVAAFVVYVGVSLATYTINCPCAPDRPDWQKNQPAFEALIETMPPAPPGDAGPVSFDIPLHVGEYDMRGSAWRVSSGAIFWDAYGVGLLDDAGIAYLPNGPDSSLENGSFESPDFKHLEGPWYSWAASW